MKRIIKNFNYKLNHSIGIFLVAILVLCTLCSCGNSGSTANSSQSDEITIEGLNFTLSEGWEYSEVDEAFTNDDIFIYFENDIVEPCESADARCSLQAQYEDEGIDYTLLSVNGSDAVYTEEPVNEIMYCCLFYYVDGEERELVIESDFDGYEQSKDIILEFLSKITW